jgi:hypothetical protein
MKISALGPSLKIVGVLLACSSLLFAQTPAAPASPTSQPIEMQTKNYVQANCTSDYLGSDESNRCKDSALATRFNPDGIGWLAKGTVTGTMERITPITDPSSKITGPPLSPGTAEADTRNSSISFPGMTTGAPPTKAARVVTGSASVPK